MPIKDTEQCTSGLLVIKDVNLSKLAVKSSVANWCWKTRNGREKLNGNHNAEKSSIFFQFFNSYSNSLNFH